MSQARGCCVLCLMPQSRVSGSLEYPNFNMSILDRPTCIRSRLGDFQVVQSALHIYKNYVKVHFNIFYMWRFCRSHSVLGAVCIQYNTIQYNTIQYNTIQSNLFQLSYMSIIIIIHCIFLNEKSKRICRKLNKLIRDIPRITHIVCMCELHILYACVERSHTGNALCAAK